MNLRKIKITYLKKNKILGLFTLTITFLFLKKRFLNLHFVNFQNIKYVEDFDIIDIVDDKFNLRFKYYLLFSFLVY